jgi:hypothetical protein
MVRTSLTALASPGTRTIASLAVVLFCLFKTEQYAVSVRESPVFPAYVCELIDETLPNYGIPFLADGSPSVGNAPFDAAPLRPDKDLFAALEREFSHNVGLRLDGRCRISNRHNSLLWLTLIHHSGSPDETPAPLFS